jgi:phosphomannomutase
MDLFGTAGIRGPVSDTVTPELALQVGRATGQDGAEFVVGRDGRETGQALAAALTAGLQCAGADVYRVGRVPTPALSYASRGRRGVMITASHNPPEDNGIKLFVDGQEYDSEAERRIEQRVEAEVTGADWDAWGTAHRRHVIADYREAVADYAREFGASLDGVTVAVDCGNGAASLATPQVLDALGASVIALDANLDGHFPARQSKPTPESLSGLRSFVAEREDVALGIGHDGDADRIVVVAPDGSVVHEDTILAMLAAEYVEQSTVGDPVVVTTPNASGRIDEQVRAHGGRVERTALGTLHEGIARVREGADADTAVVFAGEPWKHIHPAFGGWIDGVASAAIIARLIADRGLSTLRDPITERPYRKAAVECPESAKDDVIAALETTIPAQFDPVSVSLEYGIRIEFADGSWVLVRPSGTEPYVRVYVESDDVDSLLSDVRSVVESAVDDAT